MTTDLRDAWTAAAVRALPDRLLRVPFALRLWLNREGVTTVSVARIAEVTGLARRTVMRHVAELEMLGFLRREARRGTPGRGGRTTRTTVTIPPALAAAPGAEAQRADTPPASPAPPDVAMQYIERMRRLA